MSRITNPYNGVDFSSDLHIPSVSHEHMYNAGMVKNAYDRGIRVFACVNYSPSAPEYPLRGWRIPYKDWAAPNDLELVTRFWEGSVQSFEDKDGNIIDTDTLPQLANAEHISMVYWSDEDRTYPYRWNHRNVLGSLWGEVGNGDPSVNSMYGFSAEWRNQHPTETMGGAYEEYLNPNNQQFVGKIFGTLNHNNDLNDLVKSLRNFPEVFKAVELFNQGFTKAYNATFRDVYNRLLNMGYKLFGTSVADWAGTMELFIGATDAERAYWTAQYNNLPQEEKQQYTGVEDYYNQNHVKDCSQTRGCNVLLLPQSYNSLPANKFLVSGDEYTKAEAALDAYIAGRYYMSGFGTHKITGLEVSNSSVSLTVSGTPLTVKVISGDTKRVYSEDKGGVNTVSAPLQNRSWVRFEVYYEDKDFIYTNPIWIDDNVSTDNTKMFLLLGI